jgi:pentatricopeptide repeat protein
MSGVPPTAAFKRRLYHDREEAGPCGLQHSTINGGLEMISVVAKLLVKEGKAEEAINLFKEMMDHVAKEQGTVMYSLNRSQSNPNKLVVLERYKSKAALDAHSSSDYFKEFSGKLGTVLAGKPEIAIMDEIKVIEK